MSAVSATKYLERQTMDNYGLSQLTSIDNLLYIHIGRYKMLKRFKVGVHQPSTLPGGVFREADGTMFSPSICFHSREGKANMTFHVNHVQYSSCQSTVYCSCHKTVYHLGDTQTDQIRDHLWPTSLSLVFAFFWSTQEDSHWSFYSSKEAAVNFHRTAPEYN